MVLVDEFQDTNLLQADILRLMRPGGHGLTVVGDDVQSIYSFRAAHVRNILDFPQQYPGTTVVKLEQNYRSAQPILTATNAVIAQARERFKKDLWWDRQQGEQPALIACQDEDDQAEFLIRQILERREAVPCKNERAQRDGVTLARIEQATTQSDCPGAARESRRNSKPASLAPCARTKIIGCSSANATRTYAARRS